MQPKAIVKSVRRIMSVIVILFISAGLAGASGHETALVLLWNLALDEKRGPHAGGCDTCDGVVTIDSNTGEVTRNDEYYALAHASRFVCAGARRLHSSEAQSGIDNVAFRNADDGSLVLVVSNSAAARREFSVSLGASSFRYALPARSVATFVMPASGRVDVSSQSAPNEAR